MQSPSTKIRIWEIDVLRGIAFFFMVLDHLFYDAGILFRNSWSSQATDHFLVSFADWAYNYRMNSFADILRILLASGVFLFVSGVSANLSKSNVKRGLKLGLIALTLTLGTFLAEVIASRFFGIRLNIVIVFGILHCLSVCMLLTPLLKKISKWWLLLIAIASLSIGFYLQNQIFLNTPTFLVIFNVIPSGFRSADFYPLFPYLGIYVLGLIVGSMIYKERKSIFKKERTIQPFTYFGKNALWLYFAHQVLLVAVLYLMGILFL